MAKKLLFIVSILSLNNCISQLGINIAPIIGTLNSKDWKEFANSYEKVYSSSLTKSNLDLGLTFGYSLGIDLGFSPVYFGFKRNYSISKAYATFETGTRHFDLKSTYWYIPFGYSYLGGNNENIQVISTFSFGLLKDKLYSYSEYWDGTKSYGSENILNGVYVMNSFVFVPELSFVYFLPYDDPIKIGFFANVGYRLTSNRFLGLEDKLYLQGNYNDLYSDKSVGMILPKNYEEYITNPDTYDMHDKNNSIQKFTGILFNIGIKINYF